MPLNWKLPGTERERAGHTGSVLWAGSSPHLYPRLQWSRVEPQRFFLACSPSIRGFPVSSVPFEVLHPHSQFQ